MISSGINLVMTVIGFCVSTMFIVFVCTRLICARIHLNASRRPFPVSSRSDLGILERWVHGLEPIVVANFPTKKYSDPCFSFTDDVQCTICLVEYHQEDVLRILPPCGHSFHATCIDIWLHQHSTCPVCRISLRECPERKQHVMQPMYSSSVRAHYNMQQFDRGPYHCFSTSRARTSRAPNDLNLASDDEAQLHTECDGAQVGESVTVVIEGSNRMAKASGNKHVESPSNL